MTTWRAEVSCWLWGKSLKSPSPPHLFGALLLCRWVQEVMCTQAPPSSFRGAAVQLRREDRETPSPIVREPGRVEKRQAQASASRTHHLQKGRPPVLLLLLNSRDSDPFLTETHECLLRRELPQDQVGPPSRSAALAAVGPPRTPITKPTPQARPAWAEGGAQGASTRQDPRGPCRPCPPPVAGL